MFKTIKKKPIIKKMLITLGIVIAVLMAVFAFGYFYGSRHFVVKQTVLYFDDLPEAFDGYRIAQFSDFHSLAFHCGHEDDVPEIVDLINAQHCDMIAFTGDIVTIQSHELEGFTSALSRLSAPDGVFSVMGNHDYALYKRDLSLAQRRSDIKHLHKLQREMGWNLLLNQHAIICRDSDSIAIVGVENDGTPPHFPQFANLPDATRGIADGAFKVLLSHDPTHWRREVVDRTDIQLTLSGHTHAGQFLLFGWSPVRMVYKDWSGVSEEHRQGSGGKTITQYLHISNGVGCVPVPMRVGAWPEINVITLKHK